MNRFNQILLYFLTLVVMACTPKADEKKAGQDEAATETADQLTTPATTPESVSKIDEQAAEQVVSTERPALSKPPAEESKTRSGAVSETKPVRKTRVATTKAEEKTTADRQSAAAEKEEKAQAKPSKEATTPPTATSTEKPALKPEPEATAQAKPDHGPWSKLLQKNVSAAGKVNYAGFKSDLPALNAYLEDLAGNPVQTAWSRGEKVAYWINAYNAFTVKMILDHHPVKSIKDIHNGNPWDVKWIKLGDKTYSLNNIENDILRPQFNDPRIHFAVNCAAKSCPSLLNRAWTAEKLNEYFEQQTKAFINNSQFNKLSAKQATISNIFDWYKADFGNVIDFLNKYAATKINADAKVSYMAYDWALNN